MRYTIAHRYSSFRDGRRFGPWEGGEQVELDDVDAEWLVRDSPGLLQTEEPAPADDDAGDDAGAADKPKRQARTPANRQRRSPGADR